MLTQTGQRVARPRRQLHLKLIALRVNAGLSREALSHRTGVSRQTIRLAEEWGVVPTPRIQFAIAGEFTVADLKKARQEIAGNQDPERKLTPLDLWPLDRQREAKR